MKLLQDKSCKELAGTLPSNVNVNQEVVRSVTTPLRKRRGVVTALDQLMPHPVYGRMFWDRPAPTITTRFNSLSNGRFGHPDEDRAISIREGAALQTFSNEFRFYGANQNSLAKQIGNAVPPELAKRIGEHLMIIANNG